MQNTAGRNAVFWCTGLAFHIVLFQMNRNKTFVFLKG